jgi:hypothetical protein
MTVADEMRFLPGSYGPPVPSLLPWLARHAAPDDMLQVARTSAAQAALAPMLRWPAVADAVAEVLARRAAVQPASGVWLARLAEVLPQMAAYLNATQVTELLDADPRAEAVGYAALAAGRADLLDRALHQLSAPWPEILTAARSGGVPPLANLRLLARLASGRPVEPGVLPGSETAYLLPFLSTAAAVSNLTEDVLDTIEDYLPEPASWYAVALSARVIPYLDQDQRLRLSAKASAAPPAWADTLRELAQRERHPWDSRVSEIEAAHPATTRLAEFARHAGPAELSAACAQLISRIQRDYGNPEMQRWEPDGFEPQQGPPRIIQPTVREDRGQVPLTDDLAGAPPIRYLVGEYPDSVPVGKPFSLQAWIALGAGRGVALLPFDVPAEGRDVYLIIKASRLDALSDPYQRVHVPRDDDSEQGEFILQADAPGRYSVSILALLDGTHLGTLTAEINVELVNSTGPPRRVRGQIGMEPVAGAVSLIVRYVPSKRLYRFQLIADDYPSEVEHRLDRNPEVSINGLIKAMDQLVQGRRSFDSEEARYFLVNKGMQLWRDLIPERLREQFWQRHAGIEQLTIITDQDIVPWEVLYPKDPGHENGFLVDQFPVTRALFDRSRVRSLRLRPARFVMPPGSPSKCAEEVERLGQILGETSAEAVITEYSRLLDLLRDEDFGLLHFACHNTFDPDIGSAIRIGATLFTPDVLTHIADEERLADSAPLIFINACRAAGLALSFNKLEGWASQFMKAGASAFIGSLWEVADTSSMQFAIEVYSRLSEGLTLGQAVMTARKAISAGSADPTWLAYTVYGDPRAMIGGHVARHNASRG